MNIEQHWSNQEQINNWWINIDELFKQIQIEIDSVDNDHNESNNTQQIEQLSMSLEHLNTLMKQIQIDAEQKLTAKKLREQFEQLKDNETDLKNLRSQITRSTTIKLDPELYTTSEVDYGQGRENSISSVKALETQWLFSSRANHFFKKILGLST